jgi:RNase adaptor protein for sRNA GlmZ degradation
VHPFLSSVLSLVDASVSAYRRRGFSSLMVSFGCTGGQHRSVYLAEQLARHLRATNGVEVIVRHIELEKMDLEKMGLEKMEPAKMASENRGR